MATYIKILNNNDIKIFENPPQFKGEERKRFFYLPNWAEDLVKSFRTPTNQVGFILQLGYFKASNKFFAARKFHSKDIEFIAGLFGFCLSELDFNKYNDRSFLRHQELILANTGFRKFDATTQEIVEKEALCLACKQVKPRFMFMSLVHFLRTQKIEIPNYHTFAQIITDALRYFEKSLIDSIQESLSIEQKQLLDKLLEPVEEGYKQESKIKRYKITLLKKSHQSTRPYKIKANIQDLQCLEGLFKEIEPVITSLNLSSELIQFYAQVVIKSQIFQTSRRDESRYLLLIAFVAYQYYRLNDVLIEIMMQSVQQTLNSTEREHKEDFYNQRKERNRKFSNFSQKITEHLTTIEQAKMILQDETLSADQKVNCLQTLFSENLDSNTVEIQEQLTQLGSESKKITKNIDYYHLLETKSVKLQNRASEIVKNINFDTSTSNESLLKAIDYYEQKEGNADDKSPVDFLDAEEQELLLDSNGKFRVSLYKVLLFSKVAEGIHSGALNLKYSYKYRTFEDYLIPQNIWESNKKELLEKAGLTELQDFAKLEILLKKALEEQFRNTNANIINGSNKYATIRENGDLTLKTPKQDKEILDTNIDLFPKNRFISLFEVLATVAQISGFTNCFEHFQIKNNRDKPADKVFFAGIIGYGCNLGIRKTAKISRSINQQELENTINWYFTHENIMRANDKIVSFLEQLQLPKLFRHNQETTIPVVMDKNSVSALIP